MLSVLLTVLACTTTVTTTVNVCSVEVTDISPSEGASGDSMVLTGSPLTEAYDTLVLIGGVSAPITELERTGCESCDACRSANACLACGDCDRCDLICEEDCVETVHFTMPEVSAGSQRLQLVNAYGVSAPASLTVLDSPTDTGGGTDTGDEKDTGSGQ